MEELASILIQNGIDTTSLELLDEEFEDEIYCLTMAGPDTFTKWLKLRNLVDQTGFWPVVVSGWDSPTGMIMDFLEYDERSTKEILKAGNEVNAVEWLAASYKYQKDGADSEWEYPRGEWSANIQPNKIKDSDLQDCKGHKHFINYLILVPTKFSWEIPGYLRFGDWNSCPKPEIQVSVFKHWHELYGAEVYYIDEESISAFVTRPPQTKEEAIKLAEEHFAYTPEGVVVRSESINKLGAELLNGTAWHFWWD